MAKAEKKPKSLTALQTEVKRRELELVLAETTYTTTMLERLQAQEARYTDADEANWININTDGTDAKLDPETNRDPQQIRKLAYRFWRLNPTARGIIRNFEKFIIGREFGIDFADTQRGTWNKDRTKLVTSTSQDRKAPMLVRELWDDFAEINAFTNFAKEMVRRSFRDGGAFIRRFNRKGFILVRFVEPERVRSPKVARETKVEAGDLGPEFDRIYGTDLIGKRTTIKEGIEFLADDPVTVVAYHIQRGVDDFGEPERVAAQDMIHTKPLADLNDVSGLFLLEVVMRHMAHYAQWEEYRMVLNKFRSALVLVRKVEGTAVQARGIIEGRGSPRPAMGGREPVTTSGRREAMPGPGTIVTAGPGVDWKFERPNLDAADAERDGRRMQLSVAAGVGLPEMLITGDWSNSNYASSVESRTPAVREWEDWQEFFEPTIKRIVGWVINAAIEDLGLPEDVDRKVTIQWPSLVTKDAEKETNRNALLKQEGVLSKQTWSAREDLVYDDEQENMAETAEAEGLDPDEPQDPMHPDATDPLKKPKPGDPLLRRRTNEEARARAVRKFARAQAELATLDVPTDLREALNEFADAAVALLREEFDEDKHPRDKDGQFASGGGAGEAKGKGKGKAAPTAEQLAALRSEVADLQGKEAEAAARVDRVSSRADKAWAGPDHPYGPPGGGRDHPIGMAAVRGQPGWDDALATYQKIGKERFRAENKLKLAEKAFERAQRVKQEADEGLEPYDPDAELEEVEDVHFDLFEDGTSEGAKKGWDTRGRGRKEKPEGKGDKPARLAQSFVAIHNAASKEFSAAFKAAGARMWHDDDAHPYKPQHEKRIAENIKSGFKASNFSIAMPLTVLDAYPNVSPEAKNQLTRTVHQINAKYQKIWDSERRKLLREEEESDELEDGDEFSEAAAGSGKSFPAGPTADARLAAARKNFAFAKANNPLALPAAKRELKNAGEFAFKRARKGRLAAGGGGGGGEQPRQPAGTPIGGQFAPKGGGGGGGGGGDAGLGPDGQGLYRGGQDFVPRAGADAQAKQRLLDVKRQQAGFDKAETAIGDGPDVSVDLRAAAGPIGLPEDDLQRALREKKIESVVFSKGGINGSYTVTFADGSKAKWKPEAEEFEMGPFTQGMQWRREVAAYAVAKEVGMADMMGVATATTIQGSKGALLSWVKGDPGAGLPRDMRYDGDSDRQRITFYDFMIGNGDRHHGNWIITSGHMRMIDHGFSMPPEGGRGVRSWPLARIMRDEGKNGNTPINAGIKEAWAGKKDSLMATLRRHEVGREALNLFSKRYDIAMDPKVTTWQELRRSFKNAGIAVTMDAEL